MANYLQGKYKVKNRAKYLGDADNVVFRSSWEQKVFLFLDNNPNVLHWASEEIQIPYFHPIKQQVRQYWPDLFVEYKDRDGNKHKEVIEIKPLKDAKRGTSKNPNRRLVEDCTFAINASKWRSAVEWCKKRKLKFRVLTETEIFKN